MPVPAVFDFDESSLAAYEPDRINTILTEQPALYVNHLRIARSIAAWSGRMVDSGSDDFKRGYAQALREVAAHLRQGDYVEGGVMLDQES